MITFPQAIKVTNGLQYAIVVNYDGAPPPGAGQAQGVWSGATGDAYPRGDLLSSFETGLDWFESLPQTDVHFQTYVRSTLVDGHGRFGTEGDWGRVDFTLSNERVTFDRGTRFSFSGEVESVTGQGKEATLTGTGSWNGRSGYTFEVSVVDNAPWGVYRDTIDVVVRDPQGTIVLTSFGPKLLKQGDISVTPASG